MAISIENVVIQWMKKLKIHVSKSYLRDQILSHPDYPSLYSITDSLSKIGIANSAVQIEKDQLPEVPVPFLAHLNGMGGEFVVINDCKDLMKKDSDLYERWGV